MFEGVGHFVPGEEDVGVLQQLIADDIAEGVVLFLDLECPSVGHFRVLLKGYLLDSWLQQEQLVWLNAVHHPPFFFFFPLFLPTEEGQELILSNFGYFWYDLLGMKKIILN